MPELSQYWPYLPLFFLVAALYASVGHGGASGYLALFALIGYASSATAPAALVLNVIVAGISFSSYYRAGYFPLRVFLPFAITSIPCAFLGGFMSPSLRLYQLLLGISLLIAAGRMLLASFLKAHAPIPGRKANWPLLGAIGGTVGFVSGMVGIGGGIFLSPILLFSGWADVKRTAGVSSAFIVVNSVSGLAGHALRGNIHLQQVLPLVAVVLVGGLAGSFLGSHKASEQWLLRLLGVVLLVAAVKLLSDI
jgi:uncharacterized protein